MTQAESMTDELIQSLIRVCSLKILSNGSKYVKIVA